jgi:hypothetical protein
MKQNIYSKPSEGIFYSPFSISFDSMEKLILINFEKDPDELYNVFELQMARDKDAAKKFLVIAYRNDGNSDVYHQPGFPFASQADILNGPDFIERQLENVKFEINDKELDVFFAFTDKTGRKIQVSVIEDRKPKNKPFFLLAPVGVRSENPVSFPVYSLYKMSFAKQRYTDIEIVIGDKKHKPDTFPLPVDCSRNLMTRYSADTFNADWNKNHKGPLLPIKPAGDKAESYGISYELTDNAGHYEIKRFTSEYRRHQIVFDLFPPLPDLACLDNKVHFEGHFTISTDSSTGKIRGIYSVDKNETVTDLRFTPDKGWIPYEKRLILKIMFMIVRVFKEWPGSYVWNARIHLNSDSQPVMESAWKRIK